MNATNPFRLDPEVMARMKADVKASIAPIRESLRALVARLDASNARAEAERRDADEELDWLGEWGGREA